MDVQLLSRIVKPIPHRLQPPLPRRFNKILTEPEQMKPLLEILEITQDSSKRVFPPSFISYNDKSGQLVILSFERLN